MNSARKDGCRDLGASTRALSKGQEGPLLVAAAQQPWGWGGSPRQTSALQNPATLSKPVANRTLWRGGPSKDRHQGPWGTGQSGEVGEALEGSRGWGVLPESVLGTTDVTKGLRRHGVGREQDEEAGVSFQGALLPGRRAPPAARSLLLCRPWSE